MPPRCVRTRPRRPRPPRPSPPPRRPTRRPRPPPPPHRAPAPPSRRPAGPVSRLSGIDRYATAAAISASAFPAGAPVAFVATGESFPDALAAGPVAGCAGGPLLLATATQLPASTVAELRRLHPQRVFVL